MELTYYRKGDYLFPNLAVKDEPQIIGKYGMLRRTYLKENRKNWYQSMLMSGRLNQHLAQIEEAAESRVETLLDSLNEKFPAPSKEKDLLAWAAHQNNLTAMAEEIVLKESIPLWTKINRPTAGRTKAIHRRPELSFNLYLLLLLWVKTELPKASYI